jgi:hypothetical protein
MVGKLIIALLLCVGHMCHASDQRSKATKTNNSDDTQFVTFIEDATLQTSELKGQI